MLNRNQWILVGFATIALLVTFIFGKTKKTETTNTPIITTENHEDHQHEASFDIEAYLKSVKSGIQSKDSLSLLQNAENEFKTLSANTERVSKAEAAAKVANYYAAFGDPLGNAFYFNEAATLTNKEEDWSKSGNRFYSLVGRAPSEDIKSYLIESALNAYNKALSFDSTNVQYKLQIAACYVESGANPMQGITMLLDIVKRDSTNADAQFMLGKFSMMSGQFDKAINRLEKVLHSQPQNSEAMFLLAEAYKNTGKKEKAIQLFEQCKKLIDNKDIQKEIDRYIKETKGI